MAIRGAVRYKPDTYRSSLSTSVANLEPVKPTVTPGQPEPDPTIRWPRGTIYMVAQLVAYDDSVLTTANYKPGSPATESEIVVLYEETISKELSNFIDLTNAQSVAEWTASINEFKTRVTPAGLTLLKAIRSARLMNPIVI